jgi:hypothetical protein
VRRRVAISIRCFIIRPANSHRPYGQARISEQHGLYCQNGWDAASHRPIDTRKLNQLLSNASNELELQHLFYTQHTQLDHIHLAALTGRLAKLAELPPRPPSQQKFHAGAHRHQIHSAQEAQQQPPQAASPTPAAKAQDHDEGVADRHPRDGTVTASSSACNHNSVDSAGSVTDSSLGTGIRSHAIFMSHVVQAILAELPRMGPRQCSNILWALVKLGLKQQQNQQQQQQGRQSWAPPAAVLDQLLSRLLQQIANNSAQDISQVKQPSMHCYVNGDVQLSSTVIYGNITYGDMVLYHVLQCILPKPNLQ